MLQIKLKLLLYIQSTCLLLFIIYKNLDPRTLALSIILYSIAYFFIYKNLDPLALALSIVFLFYLLVFFLFIINIYKQMCTALD